MRVLVVEDDDVTAFLTIRIAEESGLFSTVEWVRDGELALQRVVSAYRLILLDLGLPVLDGAAFLEQFHRDCEEGHAQASPVVLLSSSEVDELNDLKQRFPMVVGSIAKPLTVNGLHRVLENAAF